MHPRHFAIVPAAGHSLRMGRAKLLLPVSDQPMIAATIRAWRQSRVAAVLAVVRPGDLELFDACAQAGALVVTPALPPPDMKASIQIALEHIERAFQPASHDAFLVAPADMPRLSPAIIDKLIDTYDQAVSPAIFAPSLAGKRGHPVLFPWPVFREVRGLAQGQGLNVLVERGPLTLVSCDELVQPGDEPFADIDTPADYQRLTGG